MAKFVVLSTLLLSIWLVYFCSCPKEENPGALNEVADYLEPKAREVYNSFDLPTAVNAGKLIVRRGPVPLFFEILNTERVTDHPPE